MAERFVVWRYVFIVIVANLIHYKMVEGQHGIDYVKVAGKRALHSVIDNSVISERIVALKTGFVWVLENLESPGILLWLSSPGKRPLVLESSGNLLNSAKNRKCREGSKEN